MIVQPATPLSALRTFPLLRRGKQSQFGAAILVAMLVVTLVATLAAGLQWRQWRAYSQEAALRTQSQATWVQVGALDWARLILREDARSNQNAPIDHLGEPWAVPLQEAKLSSFLSTDSMAGTGQDEAYLSGQITDAQSKINLTNLVQSGKLSDASMQVLYRLYQQLNLPVTELRAWTQLWLETDASYAALQTAPPSTGHVIPLRPAHITQLAWLGVSPASTHALRPHLTILPLRTQLNLNTANAVVIYAAVPDITIEQAENLVKQRAQAPLQNLEEAKKILKSSQISETEHSVFTQHFELRSILRMGDWTLEEQALVQRNNTDVKTIWRMRGAV